MNDSALLISTRVREVWPKADKQALDRAAKLCVGRGVSMFLRCGSPVCPEPSIAMVRDQDDPNGAILRCGCTDRIFTHSF